ncbi:MAG: hypothetical protein JXA25_02255 [Anaerolineales bacterium]|nr:hypothetical protein [Anaerolineales bacterium]
MVFLSLCALSLLKIIWIRRNEEIRPAYVILLLIPIAAGLAAAFAMYPVGGLDLFHYIFKAKMMVVYNANPYIQIARKVAPSDPFFIYDPFPDHTLGYGPLWTLLAKWTFRITAAISSSESILSQVIGFKTLNLFFWVGIAILIWSNRPDLRSKLLSTIFFLGNPLVLFELITNAHNDAMMVFFLLSAIILLQKKRAESLLAFTASLLIKPFALILLPLGIVYAVKEKAFPLRKWLSACGQSLFLFFLCWIPFLDSPHLMSGFLAGMQHANALKTASIFSLLREASSLFGLSGWVSSLAFILCASITLLASGVLILQFLRGDPLLRIASMTYLIFCAILTNMLPWYLVFVITAAAFSNEWLDLAPAYTFTFLGLVFYLLSIWAWYDSGGSTFTVHLLQAGALTFPILLYSSAFILASRKRLSAEGVRLQDNEKAA